MPFLSSEYEFNHLCILDADISKQMIFDCPECAHTGKCEACVDLKKDAHRDGPLRQVNNIVPVREDIFWVAP